MIWVLVMLTILLLGGVALVAAGYGDSMRPAQPDRRQVSLPDGPVTAHDLETIEFNTGLRGYAHGRGRCFVGSVGQPTGWFAEPW
ncbi:MAG: hypothetical protein R2709_05175 [Marmoricola sp.]